MSSWTTLSDASLTAGKKITAFILRALRDNITAVASGASGAPKITTAAINDLAVTTGKLANGAVTSGKIGVGQVLTSNIGNLQVTTGKIAEEEVTSAKLAPDAVRTRYAETGYDVIGAVGLMMYLKSTGVTPGSVYPGSDLKWANASGGASSFTAPGNWRALGNINNGQNLVVTLFMRVS